VVSFNSTAVWSASNTATRSSVARPNTPCAIIPHQRSPILPDLASTVRARAPLALDRPHAAPSQVQTTTGSGLRTHRTVLLLRRSVGGDMPRARLLLCCDEASLSSLHRTSALTMSERKAVIKNADMSEDMQQDAIDCATQVRRRGTRMD
jgi:hypothetical protein